MPSKVTVISPLQVLDEEIDDDAEVEVVGVVVVMVVV